MNAQLRAHKGGRRHIPGTIFGVWVRAVGPKGQRLRRPADKS